VAPHHVPVQPRSAPGSAGCAAPDSENYQPGRIIVSRDFGSTMYIRAVLADGLFQHIAPFDKEQEANVEIPNINCAKCTLQVIEFMAAHNRNREGDFTYHHCAELQIRANPSKPIDTRFPGGEEVTLSTGHFVPTSNPARAPSMDAIARSSRLKSRKNLVSTCYAGDRTLR
jgi:hypothetical protein